MTPCSRLELASCWRLSLARFWLARRGRHALVRVELSVNTTGSRSDPATTLQNSPAPDSILKYASGCGLPTNYECGEVFDARNAFGALAVDDWNCAGDIAALHCGVQGELGGESGEGIADCRGARGAARRR